MMDDGGIGFNTDKLVDGTAGPVDHLIGLLSGSIGLLGLGINNRDTYIPP